MKTGTLNFNFTRDQLTDEFVIQFSQLIDSSLNNGTASEEQLNSFLTRNTQNNAKSNIESCFANKSLDCVTNQVSMIID